ncbi:hypothetical protein P3T76_008190 [Phytophthora citrophthora]|uniref:M96 mating-specific protein family n=1 Tax=Phytophthora citrophthora TaxID=4793 RepID=A0AAD9GL52_9STRA|nr:hypothetical protein P3T76_008207 [Phytophthora citrophthora]KAK1940739.1 hypothetical protein P3T76_008190 [Phytophthora citrophthora]
MLEEEFLLDESSVLAFLADCEMVTDAPPSPALSTPTQIDTLPSTWSDTFSSADTSSSISSSSSPERPAEAKKTWRQRRKEEVLHLREVAKLLSAELEQLKMAAGVRSTLPHTGTKYHRAVAKREHKTEASMIWEKIAERQSSLRLRSEEENAKLREAVTQHLQQAKSLQRAIKRKLREDSISSSMDLFRSNRLNTRGVTPPQDNKAVFDVLMAGLDDVYENVDGFFETMGMQKLPCPGRKNNTMESRRSRGMFVEFLDNYPLPFNVQETADAIWTPVDPWAKDNVHFVQVSVAHVELMEIGLINLMCFCILQNFAADRDTQMKSMSFSFFLEGMDFWVIQRCVKRKYVENGRVVFVSRTLIQPVYDGMSISLIETTRMVLKPGELSALGPSTVMQTHREATIHGDLSVVDAEKYPSIDVGLKTWETGITNHNNRVEDQLVRAMS